MKKSLILVLALMLALTFTACGNDSDAGKGSDANKGADADVKSEGVMTYAEYAAAALDTEVTIEAYVQAHQSWCKSKCRDSRPNHAQTEI